MTKYLKLRQRLADAMAADNKIAKEIIKQEISEILAKLSDLEKKRKQKELKSKQNAN